ncbi:hypothetical protein HBH98_020050 [Parastagonospora nodorum]|nr:hypothetical protein HBH98_020050 [Parastagonospora nodorum]KAH4381494.1 hypothetical protein HBH97_086120 [Parastagonospora nodorum]KAH4425950.1 hypothetical protein HBH99_029210 [Parastagonospora nodorum]KAH4995202.1 hypothetical protein HBI76_003970 [Parastagonospora nodorum]KAH5191560.1 hypothetical protein HBH76_080460 [Parastagonospora nodorum]
MSARGARSRKVQTKDIEKKEKKDGKKKVVTAIHEPLDGFADWRTTPNVENPRRGMTRTLTSSSRATSRSSGTNESNNRPRLATLHSSNCSETRPAQSSGGGSASVSDISVQGKEKKLYDAKGKETQAPRGRGGGVPIKRTVAPSPVPPAFRADSSSSHPSGDQKSWLNFKIWKGSRDAMRPYGGFEFDEDMSTGSVLIYFKEEQMDHERPLPSIRARLDVLENSGSTWLKETLHYFRIDDSDDGWALPSMSESSMSPRDYPQHHDQSSRRMLGPTSPGGRSPPPFDIDQLHDGISTRAGSRLDTLSENGRAQRSNSDATFRRLTEDQPTHKLWFTAPDHIKTAQGQRLHHVAIRNFLAMLHGKPIVGADLFDMLNTLQPQIEDMYKFDDNQSRVSARDRSIQMITNYLGQHGIDDVRTSIKSAMCLLTWSEQEQVKWRQGYLESFVHLAGVMIPELEDVPEFKRLSIVTRRNLGIAAKTLQLRKMEAEEKLAAFDFSDLWEDTSKVANSSVYHSYQTFRSFLINHYSRNYGNWPPARDQTWLNRKIALALQEDFGSLYDYLVNRDVVWNPREERASRKWEMAHRRDESFKADVPELNITDLLVRFDAKFSFAHIPHPYPLLPREIPKTTREKEKKSLFSSLKKDKSKDVTKDAKAHLQLSILFSDATNIEKLDVNFHGSTLIDKFEQFEMTTDLKNITPREARLGRWILLYGILQVLSTISVDVQGLKHTDGVKYLLCTDLKRCPEWVTNGQTEYLEASQKRSWCWQRSWDPAPTQTAPVELEATPQAPVAPDVDPRQYDSARHRSRERRRERERQREREYSSPPPPLTLNTALDGATLLHHSLDEKLALSSPRHRDTEKSIQAGFSHYKPRLDSLPQPRHHDHNDYDFSIRAMPRSTMNTDLDGYPFSPEEVQWPVPPGYTERDAGGGGGGNRESGIGYSVSGSVCGAGGNAFLDLDLDLGEQGDGRERDRRSPRRMYERGGW